MNWNSGVNINGETLDHLRFADDIVLFAKNGKSLESMLNQLQKEGSKVGLKINKAKTKCMRTEAATKRKIRLGGEEIEEVDSYVYLGQEISR